jgi:type IV secretion system protein VirB9
VTVEVKRGVPTHVLLDPAEQIQFIAPGVGSECTRDDDSWCITAARGGAQLFVHPKSAARGSNIVAIATDRRAYSVRFVVLAENSPLEPVYRLTFLYPTRVAAAVPPPVAVSPAVPTGPSESELLAMRLKQAPSLVNGAYSMKAGKASADIEPLMVWDDGRFTYFKYPANREVPAVFQVDGTGQETVVNARMDGDFLIADLVARRFYLRRGRAVVGVWNDAFDLDGLPPENGVTVPGVERIERLGASK